MGGERYAVEESAHPTLPPYPTGHPGPPTLLFIYTWPPCRLRSSHLRSPPCHEILP